MNRLTPTLAITCFTLFFFLAHNVALAQGPDNKQRIGIIGLDTSHSIAFTKVFNDTTETGIFAGFEVVAAYPHGSPDIESSTRRIPGYTEEIQKFGVKIVDSIDQLLAEVDLVLLETNDGRPHLEQVLPVLNAGKRVFVDKPIAGTLVDAVKIFDAAARYNVPLFSSSSLRYMQNAQDIRSGKIGQVLGADTYSPATIEPTHPDLFWYGVHGVEALFTVMGPGCKTVQRISNAETDIVVGTWQDGRLGTYRGIRTGKSGYGGTAFGTEGIHDIGPYEGYRPLLVEIANFFQTGIPPVTPEETLEIFAFMEAADESKRLGGKSVDMQTILAAAKEKARQ